MLNRKYYELIYLITSKLHWYQIKFIYKNNSNTEVFHYYSQIGLITESDTLNHRLIKKIVSPLDKQKHCKPYLKNGTFHIEIQCKLGYFKKQ
jgi:hypothetical protein